MRIFVAVVSAVLGLASPAFAESWRVESVNGDAVSVTRYNEPEPIDAGGLAHEGAAIVSGPATLVTLKRGSDKVEVKSDTILDLRHDDKMRAALEIQTGHLDIASAASPDGALQVGARYFRIEAQTASFSVDVYKDYATVGVQSGEVILVDLVHPGVTQTLRAGSQFRGAAEGPAKEAGKAAAEAGKTDPEAAKKAAAAEAALKDLDKLAEQKKLSKDERKKRNAVLKKLAEKGLTASKEGLQQLGEDYESEDEIEIPKIGILRFLFGDQSPGVGYVLGASAAVFLLFGYFAASALGEAAFGLIGNAAILLVGALIGAAVHDFVFPPELFWTYEPTPGVVTPTVSAIVVLVAACFARKWWEDRADAAPAKPAAAPLRVPRRKFG